MIAFPETDGRERRSGRLVPMSRPASGVAGKAGAPLISRAKRRVEKPSEN